MFYREHKAEIEEILRELCNWKGIKLLETEICPDHIHRLVEILPKESVTGFKGFLKGKSRFLIYDRDGILKYKYGNQGF